MGRSMLLVRYAVAALATLSLAACSSVQFQDDAASVPVIPVADVVGSLKCGLAKAIINDTEARAGLHGAVAKVELDVNVVGTKDASGGLTAGIPVSGGSITPSLNFLYSEVRTINSSIDLNIFLTTKDARVCSQKGVVAGRDAGFSAWIGSVVTSVNAAAAGDPKAQMTQFVFESDFVVTRGVNGGVAVDIVPVKVTTSAGSSRSDIQHLKITIAPVHFVRGKKRKGGSPYFVPAAGAQVPVAGAKPFGLPAVPLADIKTGQQRRGTFNMPQR